MKIYPEKLAAQLGDTVAPIYIISGDEPLLVQESCDIVRDHLRRQGFSERELFHVEAGFDWQQVLFSANSMSLFAEQKLLEIRMPNGKPGDKGAKALQAYVEKAVQGTSMLLVLPRLDAASQRSKWFKILEADGVFVQIWSVDVNQLPGWISTRFRRAGLKATREAVAALCDRIEGNLLAAIQEIERLRLTADTDQIDVEMIVDSVNDSARFDVFGLIDAAVGQNPQRSVKMVRGLRTESADILYIAAMLARELRSLITMAQSLLDGQKIDTVIQRNRVWAKRKNLVGNCLQKQSLQALQGYLRRVGRIDRQVKGMHNGDPWDELESLMLCLAGSPG